MEQKSRLFRGDIRDNLLWGDENASDSELFEAADIAQATDVINSKEKRLDSEVAMYGNNFSGGQKQRLAIARAIVGEPEILFADEPTGNLDSVTSKVIEDLLFDYQKKNCATLIIVTHDEELASRCNTVINIKDGKIVSQSTEEPKK